MTKHDFVKTVLSTIAVEHGGSESDFEELIPKIEEAVITEGNISEVELKQLASGEFPEDLDKKYPLLNDICTLAHLNADENTGGVDLMDEEEMDADDEDDEDPEDMDEEEED